MFRMVARETCLGFELAWSAQATESVKVSADAQRIAAQPREGGGGTELGNPRGKKALALFGESGLEAGIQTRSKVFS
jgi:hypothetical protein